MWIGVKEADLEELIEVRLDRAPGDFQSVDTGRFERRVVVYLDAVDPLQDQHSSRRVPFDHFWNKDIGLVLEDLDEAPRVGGLAHVVDLFEDSPPELPVERH